MYSSHTHLINLSEYRIMSQITNNDSVIDSRDVIERIEELRIELVDAHEAESDANEPEHFDDWLQAMASNDDGTLQDVAQELLTRQALSDQCEGYSDWGHGEPLVHEDHFQQYARRLTEVWGMVTAGAARARK